MKPDSDLRAALRTMLLGYRVSAIVSTFARSRIADALGAGPLTSDDVAASLKLDHDACARFLRAASGAGLIESDGADVRLTRLGHMLRSDRPGSMHILAASVCHPDHWRPWGELLHSVRTGESAFSHVFGLPQTDWNAAHPEVGRSFDAKMTAATAHAARRCAEAVDFSHFRRIVDLGGGQGALIAAILPRAPSARGVLFDLPQVVAEAGALLAEAGVSDRCAIVGGDFFQTVPGADAYVLKWVLHTWDNDACRRILGRCRSAIEPDGRLFLVEAVVPDGPDHDRVSLRDLNMLIMGSGRERTADGYRSLLAETGFEVVDIVPVGGTPYSIIEARPVM